MQEAPPHERFLGRVHQLTLDATRRNDSRCFALGASNVCLFRKTRRAPSRQCRDARVHGHTTTAMHDMGTPPPRPCWRFLCFERRPRALGHGHTCVLAFILPSDMGGRCRRVSAPSSQAERSHLQQRLGAIEARVSEAARDRANLSRRLAETAVEAEEAEVKNQKLQIRVRVRAEGWG